MTSPETKKRDEKQKDKLSSLKLKAITKEDLHGRLEEMSKRVLDPKVGLYGPQSQSWRVNRYTSVMMGAGCANLLQLAHPWVSQAIDQHSQTQTDPFGRLRRTFLNVHTMVFGSLDQVLDAAIKVHSIHAKITGQASESAGQTRKGSAYFANQIGAMLWVHATLWITGLRVYELFHKPLTALEKEQYYQESKLFAFLFGIPESAMPDTWQDFLDYYHGVIQSDELAVGEVGRQLVDYIFSMKAFLKPVLNRHKMHTAVLLPERLRLDFGFPQVTPALQKQFDRDVKLARGFFAVSPGAIKFMPPYLEASHRIRGESTDLVTRFSNRILYGQPLLVS
ncbi:MAG: DUF2236 domain-containing protein [Ketobacter sp.]|nr:DUF2236 domain-containing protein [Ketobacter sp.]